MILVYGSISSNHLWNLILAPIPNQYFCSSIVGSDFCKPYLDHSELIHVSESFFCEKMPNILQNLAIFMPVGLWYINIIWPEILSMTLNTPLAKIIPFSNICNIYACNTVRYKYRIFPDILPMSLCDPLADTISTPKVFFQYL